MARATVNRQDTVTLVAVSKTVSPSLVLEAYRAGQRVFGENRVQEAAAKMAEVSPDAPDAIWHLIGHLQSNKARQAAKWFDVVESVDSLRLARRLEAEVEKEERRLPILLEVNVGGEESKEGFSVDELDHAAAEVAELPHLVVTGLMTVAPLVDNPEAVRPVFRELRLLRDRLRGRPGLEGCEELSMGMTNDFRVAIQEGATIVRVGRAIFGERPRP